MLHSFFDHANYWAILVAATAYFILGSLWFSLLFGSIWSREVEKHGVKIKEPTGKEIGLKLVQTFAGNCFAALAMAVIVYLSASSGWSNGLQLGLICGFGFEAAAIIIAYTWESRSFRLMMIDFGYAVTGITACGIILSVWK